ncbi:MULTISPECIES: CvpA family protein [Enterococcus]|uniref:CvpA family protein n=1 Tax=Enterococcus TaxID=1350 RepID=UPI0007EEDC61|nr:CvpA family protein [Enterococcus mundtii]MBO1084781.1 CvpA family protein [Enterococcus mundtii]MDV7745311.1 CvpA family protein [Enterococcus mundtii]OBS63109.1 colicin V production protein CvpA [Enterococcus mundtii]
MLSLLILFILLIAFFSGASRGFALQGIYLVGYFVSFLAAQTYYKTLANHLQLYIPYPAVTANSNLVFFDQAFSFKLDEAFYAGVAFLIILFIGWLVTRFIGVFAHGLTFIPVLKQLDWVAGGILSVIITYISLVLVLRLLTFIPVGFIQNQFSGNNLATFMVERTPILANKIYDLWVTQVIN